jgi:hypothetical protein
MHCVFTLPYVTIGVQRFSSCLPEDAMTDIWPSSRSTDPNPYRFTEPTYTTQNKPVKLPRKRQGFLVGSLIGLTIGCMATLIGYAFFHHIIPVIHHVTNDQGQIQIQLDNRLLTTGMQLGIAHAKNKIPVSISQVDAQVGENQITMSADVSWQVISGNAQFSLSPVVDKNGRIDFRVVNTNIGTLGIMIDVSIIDGFIESSLNDQFADLGHGSLGQGLNYRLIDVTTHKNALIVTAELLK